MCKDTLDQLITAIELNEQERIGSEIDDLFAEMQQRGVHDKDINLNLNYLLFRLMHLASNLDNEANQKEMLQFISAQSFREGISRGSRQHLFRFATRVCRLSFPSAKKYLHRYFGFYRQGNSGTLLGKPDVAGLGQKILYQQCILRANLPQKIRTVL